VVLYSMTDDLKLLAATAGLLWRRLDDVTRGFHYVVRLHPSKVDAFFLKVYFIRM
jgi:hypothetical protein